MKEKIPAKSIPDLDNFYPKLITLLFAGAFIYWLMTSPNSYLTLHKYLIDPFKNKLDSFMDFF
tara:strand:- start:6807 stop:6995 length:189 start_codon:yes stop_codon:yes gene_type:complete